MLFVSDSPLISGEKVLETLCILLVGMSLVKFLLQQVLHRGYQTNSLRIQVPTAGSVQDFIGDDTFTPELASTLTNLFTEIFGRRLGTLTDGSTLREETGSLFLEDGKFALLETGHKIITVRDGAMTGSSEPLQSGIREVTLTSTVSVTVGTGNNRNQDGKRLGI